jgi:hypothetical protein
VKLNDRGWPAGTNVPVEASSALNDKVDGREVRDEHVKVEVQRLLHDLSGNHDPPCSLRFSSCGTEPVHHLSLNLQSVSERKPGMEEVYGFGRKLASKRVKGIERVGHGISNPATAPTLPGGMHQSLKRVFESMVEPNRNGTSRPRPDWNRELLAALTSSRHEGKSSLGELLRRMGPQSTAECLNEPVPERDRKSGAQEDGVTTEGRLASEQLGENLRHVRVAGVHLVHNQQVLMESEHPERVVPNLKCSQQRLVNGAHPDLRK